MLFLDTELYKRKSKYFEEITTAEEVYFERIYNYYESKGLKQLVSFIQKFKINSEIVDLENKKDKDVFKELILAPPENLREFCKKNITKTKEEEHAIDELKKVYTSHKILSKPVRPKEIRLNQFLISVLKINVCPYCNRNFVNNRGDRFAAQMDHFYSKDEFPWLAVSLYNLVPSCGACNHIKSTKDFSIHPFIKDDIEKHEVSFNYKYRALDDIEVTISTSDERRKDIDAIKLEEAYSIHHIDIQSMLDREEKYSTSYREELRQLLRVDSGDANLESQLSLTDDEIDRMIYGDVIFEEDINNIPLGKFKKDIYEEIKSLRDY